MDAIQEYQIAKQNHRQAEMKIAKAKAQLEVYQADIANILSTENVSSVEELNAKYQQELQKLASISKVLTEETQNAEKVLAELGVS